MSNDIPLVIQKLQKHIKQHNQQIVDDILKYGKKIEEQLDNKRGGREVVLESSWQTLYNYFEAAEQMDTWISKLVTRDQLDGIHDFQTKTLHFIDGFWYKILIQIYKEKYIDPVGNTVEYHKKVDDDKIQRGFYPGSDPDGIYEFIHLILFVTNDTKLIEDWRKLHSHSWDLRNMWKDFLLQPASTHINEIDQDVSLIEEMLNFTSPVVQINTGGYGMNRGIVPLQKNGQLFDLRSIFCEYSKTPSKQITFSVLISHPMENDKIINLYYRRDDGKLSFITLKLHMNLLERAIWHSFDYCFIHKKEEKHPLVQNFIKEYYS